MLNISVLTMTAGVASKAARVWWFSQFKLSLSRERERERGQRVRERGSEALLHTCYNVYTIVCPASIFS